MAYQIRLVNYLFDNTYENTMRFDNTASQKAFFDRLPGTEWSVATNFVSQNLDRTTIDTKLPDEYESLKKLLGFSYALVKHVETGQYLFFFVLDTEQLIGGNVRLSLENDVMQNIYPDADFADCLLQKVMLNRWVDNKDGTISFDGKPESLLFEQESIKNLSKMLKKRKDIFLNFSDDPNITTWLNNNIISWVYAFTPNSNVTIYQYTSQENKVISFNMSPQTNLNRNGNLFYKPPYAAWCAPIYKGTKTIGFIGTDGKYYKWDVESLFTAIVQNNASAMIDVRISPLPPTKFLKSYNAYFINGDGNLQMPLNSGSHLKDMKTDLYYRSSLSTQSSSQYYAAYVTNQELTDYSGIEIDIGEKYTFNKSDVIGSDRKREFNPKLKCANYKELRLGYGLNSFSYDIQKLNSNKVNFNYFEAMMPAITRAALSLSASGIYENSKDGYIGANVSIDTSLPYSVSQLQAFLANNKNFYMQRDLKSAQQGLGAVSQALSGNVGGTLMSSANMLFERAQSNLTLDNMSRAPHTMQNIDGNIPMNFGVNGCQIFFETWEALDHELAIADEIMYKNGYTYNRIGNIKSFDNVRKYFNYVQAAVDSINAQASNNIKNRIRRILANGIRFWNDTDQLGKYQKENYERWLNE